MMGRTHMLLGAASLWLLRPLPNVLTAPDMVPMLALATFGALLPDLDAAGSTLKYWRLGGVQPFVPIAQLLHGRFGHRGVLHSLRGLEVLALLLVPLLIWWPWRWYLALLLGYASHLLGDSCTKTGIPLFHPRPGHFWLLPRRWRLTTGSSEEEILIPLLALAILLLLLTTSPLRIVQDAAASLPLVMIPIGP